MTDRDAARSGAADPSPGLRAAARAVRVSDAERQMVAEIVRDAAGDGRLSLDELDERLERVYAARTRGDLVPALADLEPASQAHADPFAPLVVDAGTGSAGRRGHWEVPPHILVRAGKGDVKLDLTEAVCPYPEVVVEVDAATAWVTLVVPRGWGVELESTEVGRGAADPSLAGRGRRPVRVGSAASRWSGRQS